MPEGPSPRLLLAMLLVLVGGVYAQAAGAGFFWDDRELILQNPIVVEHRVGEALFSDLWSGVKVGGSYYRPLALLSFVLDHAAFGVHAVGYHLHSLAWHLAAVLCVHGLTTGRLSRPRALGAALVFGLHPVQSEPVLWIAARNDLMCAVGVVGCLWAAERGRLGLAMAAALVAALSKELGFLLPLDLALWRLAFGERPRLRETVAVSAALGLAAVLRASITMPAADPVGPFGVVDVIVQAFVLAVGWIAVPWPLTSTWSMFAHLEPSQVAAAGLAIGGLLLLARSGARRTACLLLLALLNWAPALVAMLRNGVIGERYLYLPLVFVAVAIAAGLPDRASVRVTGGAVVLAWLVALGVRMSDWGSERTLLEAAVARRPDGFSWNRLAMTLEREGAPVEAFRAYRSALASEPPPLRRCADPVRLLAAAGAYEMAAALADELAPRGCPGDESFRIERVRVQLLAGRLDDARQALAASSGPVPLGELPLRAAVCEADGHLTCLSAIALDWPRGPAELRAIAFDLLSH